MDGKLNTIEEPIVNYHVGSVYDYESETGLFDFITDPNVIEGFRHISTKSKRLTYINCASSFDIETTSFYTPGPKNTKVKAAIMYIWQFGINGTIITGRTWDGFISTLRSVVDYYHLNSCRRLIIYVHNLSFEFQFIKNLFHWDTVFSLKKRVPIYAVSGAIEFRCSYRLSNYALAYLGTNLIRKYPVEKKVGDLDYSLIRNHRTVMTPTEMQYCINDVLVVMAYIQERIEEEGSISEIPLTNTGYVRRHCRNITMSNPKYRATIKALSLEGSEYSQLKRAFMGGFTHANIQHVDKMLNDVASYDIASDYPARIVLEYFPMSKSQYIGTVTDVNQLKYYLSHYCCVFDFAVRNLRPIVDYESILSSSRVVYLEHQKDYVLNNGRLVSCDGWIRTTITEVDYASLVEFYTWDEFEVKNLRIYIRGYLPTPFVNAVLDFYEKKTTLKGVSGKETEYMVSKNMLNSTYGMMVTDIVREDVEYFESGWTSDSPEIPDAVEHYNRNFNRFLFYPWGVYVTAHARSQLFRAILNLENDYVYSDTDSVKILNYESHKKYFSDYNSEILYKISKASLHHKIPLSRFCPQDPSGKKHPIGYFEFDGFYKYFKTCGAKRYINTTPDDKTSITVAGLGKKAGLEYITSKYGPDIKSIYSHFTNGLSIPPGHTGKLTSTYIDQPRMGAIVDYQGNRAVFYESSATHLEPAPYNLSMSENFLRYLYGIDEDYYF